MTKYHSQNVVVHHVRACRSQLIPLRTVWHSNSIYLIA